VGVDPRLFDALKRRLFDESEEILLFVDTSTGAILDANLAACRFYDCSHEGLTSLRFSDLSASDPRWNEKSVLLRLRTHSGEGRYVDVRFPPSSGQGPRLLVVRDVKDPGWFLEALPEKRATPGGQAIVDDSGSYVFVSEGYAEAHGWTPGDLLGRSWREVYTEEEACRIEGILRSAGNGVWRGECLGLKRDGSIFHERIVAEKVVGGGVVLACRDVTHDPLRFSERGDIAVVESIEEGYYETDLKGNFTFVNDALCHMLGYTRPAMLAMNTRQCTDPRNTRKMIRHFRGVYRTGVAARNADWEIRTKQGERKVVGASLSLIRDAQGRAMGVRGVVRDITERQRAERVQSALYRIAHTAASAEDMQELYAEIHAIVGALMYAKNFSIALLDPASQSLDFPYVVDLALAPRGRRRLGRGLTEYVLRTGQPLLADANVSERLKEQREIDGFPSGTVDFLGVPLKKGEETFGVLSVQSYDAASRFTDGDKDLLNFVSQHVANALVRRRSDDALKESEQRFRTLAETAPCAILIHQDGQVRYANATALALFGYSRQELSSMSLWDMVHVEDRELVRERVLARQGGEVGLSRFEFRIATRSGQERWLDFSVGSAEFNGKPAFLGTAFDISDRKKAEQQIQRLAYHDALTGLPNRLLFNDRVSVAVAQAHRQGQNLAILFLDLDEFKAINDSWGHSFGDRLLREVSGRLERCVREGDTVARLAGDEFTILLPGLSRPVDLAKVAKKVLDTLKAPFKLEGLEIFITASMGISLYPSDGENTETLVKNADTAMYRAKEKGRDGYQLWAPSMGSRTLERPAMENNLRKALARREFVIHYQPVLELATGRVHGLEALLRWQHPEKGLLSASEFIWLAEVTGLILPIDPWVLRGACAQVKQWQQRGDPLLCAGVNLSARQLQQPDLAVQVRRALEETGLEPRFLELEISESSALQNAASITAVVEDLKALGVKVSLDDFGIGHSSLNYLKQLKVDALKLDHSLIRDLLKDPNAALASSFIAMAHSLNMLVVAEGVETEDQLAFLRARNCDRMHGYLFSRPLSADDCSAFLVGRTAMPSSLKERPRGA